MATAKVNGEGQNLATESKPIMSTGRPHVPNFVQIRSRGVSWQMCKI